jgi:hypothetical protein
VLRAKWRPGWQPKDRGAGYQGKAGRRHRFRSAPYFGQLFSSTGLALAQAACLQFPTPRGLSAGGLDGGAHERVFPGHRVHCFTTLRQEVREAIRFEKKMRMAARVDLPVLVEQRS